MPVNYIMTRSIAIIGIHTDIGKTIAAAVLAEAMNADYWKPVQAGTDEKDSVTVKQLLTNGDKRVHDEAIVLSQPMSPHAAAVIDGVDIDYTKFVWPTTSRTLLVETAGGILSPMTGNSTMADFVAHHNMPAILVAQNYLGSINHTLLSIEVLKSRGIRLLGIVMNGEANDSSETFIEQYSKTPIIARIPHFGKLDNETISIYAATLKESLLNILYADN